MTTKRNISNVFVDNADDLYRLKRGKRRKIRMRSSLSGYWTPQMVNNINLAIEGHSFLAVGGYGETIYRTRINDGSYFDGAVAGTNIAAMIGRQAALNTHLIVETATRRNVLLLWSGVNDVTDTVGSGTTAYNAVKPYVQDEATIGWKVLFFTMPPAINETRGAQYEIERNAFITLAKNDLSLINHVYILDTDTIPELNAPADVSNLLYFEAAGLHITTMAHWLTSDLFVTQITNMYSANAIPIAVIPTVFTVTKTGTGAGVASFSVQVTNTTKFTLDGNGLFYTDVAGTLNPSNWWVCTPGGDVTIYLKCSAGVSNLTFDGKQLIKLGSQSGSNAPSIGGDVSGLINLTRIYDNGNNTLSGSISGLVSLTYLVVYGSNTLSGSVAALTLLTTLDVAGSNTLSGSIAALASLTTLCVQGTNIISGDLKNISSHLTDIYLPHCGMVDYTAGATWGNGRIIINPSVGYGYSATEIDNMLIDMAASVALISRTITLQGSSAARTAASNAAVATLTGAGRTNTVTTN